jgi:hypothetical protein
MIVIACGDRNWTDRNAIEDVLLGLPPGSVVVHGGSRGADRMAGEIAAYLGFTVVEERAEWEFLGLRAGPIRNQRMLSYKPEIVFAFHRNLAASRGTKHMVGIAKKAGVRVVLID